MPEKFRYMKDLFDGSLENTMNPVVFTDSAKLYEWPDSTSEIIEYLKKNEALKIIKQGSQSKPIETDSEKRYIFKTWYKVETKYSSGYILADDISRYTLHGGENVYFVKTDAGDKHNSGDGITVYKYDNVNNTMLDTFYHHSVSGGCVVKIIDQVNLKNIDLLFCVTQIRPYCGGGSTHLFIADANNKLSEFIAGYAYGDAAEYDISAIWLPVTFHDGKIKFLENGDSDVAFSKFYGKIIEHDLPENISVPLSELIIVENENGAAETDENGDYIKKPNGDYNILKTKTTEFLKWNGHQLQKIK